ncbi:MAG: preprotein translocase subunit YajC [bacterium]|nr:preprotein translocase subunit YajC [bacterium]
MTPLLLVAQDPPTEPPPAEPGGGLMSFLPFILIGVVFWVLLIGPERKNRKKRTEMLTTLAKDDKVMTTGGLYGRVARVEDEVVTLVVADGVRMRFARQSIQGIVEESSNHKKQEAVEKEG